MKMKPILFLLINILLFSNLIAQPCKNDTYFRRQSQLDSIKIIFPGCNTLDKLYILGSDISSLEPLSHFEEIKYMYIWRTSLTSFDGLNISKIDTFYIEENQMLTSISSVSKIKNIKDFRLIRNNALETAAGIRFDSVHFLAFTGLSNLKDFEGVHVKYSFRLGVNKLPKIKDFTTFDYINVEDWSFIHQMDSLESLNGLENQKIKTFMLDNNKNLSDISAINTWDELENLSMYGNKNLTFCAVNKICDNLDNPDFSLRLRTEEQYKNGVGCSSKEEIRPFCVSNTSAIGDNFSLNIYPNPTSDILNIETSSIFKPIPYKLYNSVGKILDSGVLTDNYKVISLDHYASGLYFLQFTNENEISIFRIVKI